jgi:hypothetical protein
MLGVVTNHSNTSPEWLVAVQSSARPKTFNQYKQIVRQHIIPSPGKIKVKDLGPERIQALYNQKLKGGTSIRTVILIHAVLHKALKQAFK